MEQAELSVHSVHIKKWTAQFSGKKSKASIQNSSHHRLAVILFEEKALILSVDLLRFIAWLLENGGRVHQIFHPGGYHVLINYKYGNKLERVF